MLEFIDQLNRKINLKATPIRIISTVPSQTELLYDLGLDEEVIGITKFCFHPQQWFKSKTRIGGTKNLNIEKIKQLQPDLIIGNKEENNESQLKELMQHFPVWISDIKTLEDSLKMIFSLGEITGKQIAANEISETISQKFNLLKNISIQKISSVAYLIWNNPLMTVGCDTFIHSVLNAAKFENVFKNQIRYPEISNDQLQIAKPDYIFLSSEPFPFKQKHVDELQQICPDSKIILVDGEYFSWYGSRLIKAADYLTSLSLQLNN